MSSLIVSLDPVAALRAVGGGAEPDPAPAAVLAELGGADGVAVRLRVQGPVSAKDLFVISGVVKTRLVVETPPRPEQIDRVVETRPWMAVLVGEPAGADAAAPLDLRDDTIDFSDIVARLQGSSIWAAALIQPDQDQAKAAAKLGLDAVLLDCRQYSLAATGAETEITLEAIARAAQTAAKAGLEVLCGGGLDLRNLRMLAELDVADGFLIGRALTARALLVGMQQATRDLAALVAVSSE